MSKNMTGNVSYLQQDLAGGLGEAVAEEACGELHEHDPEGVVLGLDVGHAERLVEVRAALHAVVALQVQHLQALQLHVARDGLSNNLFCFFY